MVADLEFLRDEPLRDLVLDDGGDARLDVVEDVAQLELRLQRRRRHLERAIQIWRQCSTEREFKFKI